MKSGVGKRRYCEWVLGNIKLVIKCVLKYNNPFEEQDKTFRTHPRSIKSYKDKYDGPCLWVFRLSKDIATEALSVDKHFEYGT